MLVSWRAPVRILFYIAVIFLMGNINALLDLVLRPAIPYLDLSHLLAGGAMAFFAVILCALLENNVKKSADSPTPPLTPITWLLAAGWALIVFGSLTGDIMQQRQKTVEVALHEARTVYEKDLNYYRWATGHDGVYVPLTAETAPNPYLAHMTGYKLTAANGMTLTLVNPEYMIRQVYEMQPTANAALGHITSLDPIRAQNAADPWERAALEDFEKGTAEVFSIEAIAGQPYLRLMRPMITEPGCLKCHAQQGYKPGDIRGGISVAVPMTHLYALSKQEISTALLGHLGLWLLGLLGIFLGSNRLRRSIGARQRAEARTRAIIDNMFDGLITVQEDGTIDTLNVAATKMFGYEPPELHGSRLDRLVVFRALEPTAEAALFQNELVKLVDNSSELNGRRRNGSLFPLQIALSRMIFGRQVLFIAMVRDITEEKIRKAEALQAGKLAAIGELAAGVAHEINNPINGVINYAQLMLDEYGREATTEGRDILGRIIKESERVAGIVSNLLSFARQRDEDIDAILLHEIIGDSISLIKHQLRKEGINLVVDVPEDLPVLRGNPHKLEQVFLNIFSNARYALNERHSGQDPAKRLVINSCVLDWGGKEMLRTTITDYGTGIPAGIIDRVFESLYSTKPAGKGTGLGLGISRDLVREHGGCLQIASVEHDHTVVTIDLPTNRS